MNEELQKALTEVLQSALSAKDFILAEIPDVIQQLLLWKFWYFITMEVMGILIITTVLLFVINTWKWSMAKLRDGDPWFLGYILLIVPIGVSIDCLLNLKWLQIWVAPKVYLIEYAASLTK